MGHRDSLAHSILALGGPKFISGITYAPLSSTKDDTLSQNQE